MQSTKGKWYLCAALLDHGSGEVVAEVFRFHKCPSAPAGAEIGERGE
ncbi:MAG: hypothetical protein ACYCTZ_04660 [Candidatus Dormibacteria bacterium]